MIRRILVVGAAIAGLAIAHPAASQGFELGYTDIGPTIGLGGVGSASLSFGVRGERAIRDLPDFGDGVLGVMAGADYYSWSSPSASWSYIPIGVTANYHFKLEDLEKVDPFLGAGLGYQIISCSWQGSGTNLCGNSAIYFIGRAGARYFLSPNMALYGDIGAGAATLNVGVTFKIG